MKMYLAEVLSKFPVVQHFLFGSIFLWEPNLISNTVAETVHLSNQPKKDRSTLVSGTVSTQQRKTHFGAVNPSKNKNTINENTPQTAKVVQPLFSGRSSYVGSTRAPWTSTTDQAALPVQSNSAAYTMSAHKLRNPGVKE